MKIKKVEIVSLSSGVLGEDFIEHEMNIGIKRLESMNLEVLFSENSKRGIEYLKEHPEKRAEDLINAFKDESVDMILCAIGGEDTYRLLPYLFENEELKKFINQKVFLGFSDSTINHFMLHKYGIKTFYGQAFLPDICELEDDMLPYSKKFFEELVQTGKITEIRPSGVWYEEREDFSIKAIGKPRRVHENRGFELLRGNSKFSGEILGGCIESIYSLLEEKKHPKSVTLSNKYKIFPSIEDWKNKILLLETSEEKPNPKRYEDMIKKLQDRGIFDVISGLIVGKPQDEDYYEEYKKVLLKEISNENLSILYNFNVGHATPRCIVPFGVTCEVNADKQVLNFKY
ncbi:MAG: LD-carboxypeptidase [Lagierella massiliensis]|nr:LD-carboxypeptidase [Lagierella massiliensis]